MAPLVGGLFFARRNLRLGRGDRRNATRLAVFVIGLMMLSWIFGAHPVLTFWEMVLFLRNLGMFLLVGGGLWVLYIAIEPFVRRRWPQILVSWTRLLSGDWRDTLVAHDAIAGCAAGVFIVLLGQLTAFVPRWLGYPESYSGDSRLRKRRPLFYLNCLGRARRSCLF